MEVNIDININDFFAKRVLGGLSKNIDSLRNLASKINPLANFQKGAKKSIESVNDLESKLKALTQTRDLSIDYSQIRRLNREIDQTQQKINKLTNSASSTPQKGINITKTGLVVGNAVGSIIANVAGVAANVLKDNISEVFNNSIQAKALNESIKFSGGVEGAKNLDFLAKTSDKYGFALTDTRVAFQQLSGAFMGTTLAGEPMRQIFDGISAAGRAMNMSGEQMQGSILALGQMMSKGKVSAEELRGQLGERLPGAFQIAARSIGVTTQELDKMLSDGKVMSEDFLPKFAAELQRTFGAQAQSAAESFSAKIQRLKNKFETIQLKAFELIEPLLSRAADFANKFMDNIQPISNAFSQIGKALEPVRILLNKTFTEISAKGLAQSIGGVISSLTPLISRVVEFAVQMQNIRMPFLIKLLDIVNAIKNPLMDIVGLVMDIAVEISSFITDILSDFLDFSNFSVGLSSIMEGLKSAIRGVLNFVRTLFFVFKPIITALVWLISKLVSAILYVVDIIVNVLGKALDFFFQKFADRFDLIPKKIKMVTGLKNSQTDGVLYGNNYGSGKNNLNDLFNNNTKNNTSRQIENTASAITSGGSKPTIINISIGKFQEQLIIQANTAKEGIDNMQREVEEALLRVINGASLTQVN